jgi:hypothetical protein
MKQLFITLIFIISIVFNSFSQNDDAGNLIYPNNFNISSHVVTNGFISYQNNISVLKGSFGITVADIYKPYFSEIKTMLFLKSKGLGNSVSIPGPSFKKEDFVVNGITYSSSKIKEFEINFYVNPLYDYELQVIYQYYFNPAVNLPNQTTAGWAPAVTHGKEWYTHNKKYGFSPQIDPTTISGPGTLCDEGNFIILNPGTVTLENASGIATLTALGNNQWKVTRTGQANGYVVLKSTKNNSQPTEKNIVIGTMTSGTISGQASLQLGESRTFTLNLLDNTDYIWSINYNPNVILTKNSATSITLSTTGSVPTGWSENIIIRAKAVSNCGTAENEVTKTIKFVNERDPRLD